MDDIKLLIAQHNSDTVRARLAVATGYPAELALAFRDELERLAFSPTEREAREELDEVAQEVLEKYGWTKSDSIAAVKSMG